MNERELYGRAKQVFLELLESSGPERAARLAEQGLGTELEDMVRELLVVHDAERAGTATGAAVAPAGDALPDSIAGYRVLRRVGAGGMGVVFEAEQERPRRRVALKIVRPGLWSDPIQRRFEQEAEILARLSHPGIAQVYEAGTFDGGSGKQSFFALEFVDGVDLIRAATEGRLDQTERLSLLLQVCAAAQHAHDRGVVHRDLKPDNLLVGVDGRVKVLDFGIARALDLDGEESIDLTLRGQVLGTLPYMSPEQVNGDPVDARTDVYAIGVITYELLAGTRPLDLDGLTLTKAAEIIARREPPRLGTLVPSARGDLETIVAVALRKDPERRYASAREFAEDIERTLRFEPIRARPLSAVYQLRKFARRHRAVVAGLAVAALAVAVAVPTITVSMLRSRTAAQRTASVNDWLTSVLSLVHPNAQGAQTRLIDTLDLAATEVEERFGDDPEQELMVRALLADMYRAQSMNERGLQQLERALELVAHRPATDRRRLKLESSRTLLWLELDRVADVREAAPPLLERLQETLGAAHESTLQVRRALGMTVMRGGEFDRAGEIFEEVLRDATAALGRTHGVSVDCAISLATTRLARGRRSDETQVRRALLDDCIALVGSTTELLEQVEAQPSMQQLALMRIGCDAHLELDQFAQAERVARDVIERTESRYAEHHTARLDAFQLLATALEHQGRLDEAAHWAIRTLDGFLETEGPQSPLAMGASVKTLGILLKAGRFEDAERRARRGLSDLPEPPWSGWIEPQLQAMLACSLIGQLRDEEARPLVDGLTGPDAAELRLSAVVRAPLLLAAMRLFERAEQFAKAEELGLEAHRLVVGGSAPDGVEAEVRAELVRFYRARGDDDAVARWSSPQQ